MKIGGERHLLDGFAIIQQILEEHNMGEGCVEEINSWKKKLDKYDDKQVEITEADAEKLSHDADNWNNQIHRDLNRKHVVEMGLQSGLNPDELLKMSDEQPSEFIQEETWNRLTAIEKSDFCDAARCLLLGSATPSVMVVLRGAEASIRNYYQYTTKEEPRNKTWRQLLHDLKSKASVFDIEDTFIAYLDYFGKTKRNFAQHPNKIYSLREAAVIFMQIMGMVEDIYVQIQMISVKSNP